MVTSFVTSFVTGFVASAIVVILYGLFIAQKEESIRKKIQNGKNNWLKKNYVNAFIGAVRGRANTSDTSMIAMLWLLIIISLALFLQLSAENLKLEQKNIEYEFNSIVKSANEIKLYFEEIELKNNESILKQAKTIEGIEAIKSKYEKITQEVEKTKSKIDERKKDYILALILLKVLYWFLYILAFLGYFFWYPFIVMRKRFSHEIERYTLRIQGLASKAELAELSVLESEVNSEVSLKKFVEKSKFIAKRHNVPQLVKTFDLWSN